MLLALFILIMTASVPLELTLTQQHREPALMATLSGHSLQTERAPPTPMPIQLWNYTDFSAVNFQCSPAIADIDGDRKLETLIGTANGTFYCFSATGGVKWSFLTGGVSESCPAIANVFGELEVVVGSDDSYVYCFNASGIVTWSFHTNRSIYSSPAVDDINGDGIPEILIGSSDSYVYCLNGETGAGLWAYKTQGYACSPVVADVDGDGQLEVLVGSQDMNLYCLNRTGGFEWNFTTHDIIASPTSPTVADVDGDHKMEILFGSFDGMFYCLNVTGGLPKVQWSYMSPYAGAFVSSPTIVDIDVDGKPEMLVSCEDDFVYCFNGAGGVKWSYLMPSWSDSTPAVADVDGDAKLEIIVGASDDKLYCLNANGGQEWNYTTKGWVYSSPSVADINGDNRLEVLVGSDDNRTYCLSIALAPFNSTAFPWPSIGFRGDIRHTGSYVDIDYDGLTDAYEWIVMTKYYSWDTDRDGRSDYQEFLTSENPFVDEYPAPAPGFPTSVFVVFAAQSATLILAVAMLLRKDKDMRRRSN